MRQLQLIQLFKIYLKLKKLLEFDLCIRIKINFAEYKLIEQHDFKLWKSKHIATSAFIPKMTQTHTKTGPSHFTQQNGNNSNRDIFRTKRAGKVY